MASGGMRIVADELREIAFGAIGLAFTAVGAVYTNPIRLLSIKNDTDADMYFSYDGVTVQEYIPAQTGMVLDFTSNSGATVYPLMASGTTIYVAQVLAAPTSGIVAVSAYHAIGD